MTPEENIYPCNNIRPGADQAQLAQVVLPKVGGDFQPNLGWQAVSGRLTGTKLFRVGHVRSLGWRSSRTQTCRLELIIDC